MLLAAALPARADEVKLANGDRYTGEMISLANGVLTFKADVGNLTIRWSDVTSLAVDVAVFVTVGDQPPILTSFDAADADGKVTLMPGGPVPLAEITALSLRNSSWDFGGGGGIGLVQTSGNTDVNNLRLSAELIAKTTSNRYTGTAIVTHARDRGVETARNWSASAKYDRFITSRLFATANAVFTNDRFRDIDLRTAYGAGAGLQLLNGARVKLTGSGGVGEVRENFLSIPDDRYTAAYHSGSLTLAIVPGRAELFHSHDAYYQITQGDKRFFRTQNGIRFGLAAGFVATIQQDLDYDKRPSPGRQQTDRTFSLSLGYRF